MNPTLDIQAPDGRRVVLRPVISPRWLPGTNRGALAVVFVLCGVWLATSFNRLNHTDLWGHLCFGRWIVDHGTLPRANPFSSYQCAEPFRNVPWLSQVLGYLCYHALGAEGMVFIHALLFTATAGCLMLATRGRGVSWGLAAVAAAAWYVLCLPIVGTIRPQVLGMLAFAVTLWAMGRLPFRRDPLVWLPLIFALWANLHGSFLLGLLALGGFAAGWTWEKCRLPGGLAAACKSRCVQRLWLALLLCTAACCLNPCGIKLWGTVATFSENMNLRDISEWRTTTLPSLSGMLILCSFLISAVLLRWSPRRITAYEIVLFLLFGLAALTALRMLVWWAVVWPWLAARHAKHVGRLLGAVPILVAGRHTNGSVPFCAQSAAVDNASQQQQAAAAAHTRTLIVAAVLFVTVIWSPPSYALITGRCRPAQAVFSAGTPCAIADELARRQITARIVAPMDWADYLIWRTGGAVEPLVYSHVHLFAADLWDDFLRIEAGGPGWLDLTDFYGVRYLVIDRSRQPQLTAATRAEPRCRVCYQDEQAILIEIQPQPPAPAKDAARNGL